MKNIVLVDFTPESLDAVQYAIGFNKMTQDKLELVNVSGLEDKSETDSKLKAITDQHSSGEFTLGYRSLVGELEDALGDYIEQEDIGFVFCGTHEVRFLERFFSSRVLNLMNHAKANFIFVPKNLKDYRPIKNVFLPIFSDKHSLQNIGALHYLHKHLTFDISLVTNNKPEEDVKDNLIVASKLLKGADLPYSVDYFGDSESELRKNLASLAKLAKSDIISIVNLTESNLFNLGEKGFVEGLIRNKQGLPVLVIQHQNNEVYGGFHSTGG
ncbi:MAG: universal stress protein [Crocinitomicaceae bacterium]